MLNLFRKTDSSSDESSTILDHEDELDEISEEIEVATESDARPKPEKKTNQVTENKLLMGVADEKEELNIIAMTQEKGFTIAYHYLKDAFIDTKLYPAINKFLLRLSLKNYGFYSRFKD